MLNGKILVADVKLQDRYFGGSVVLILRYQENIGASGVILNKTTKQYVKDFWRSSHGLAQDPVIQIALDKSDQVVNLGGPVDTPIMCVHEVEDAPNSLKVSDGIFATSDADGIARAIEIESDKKFRFYHGFAGWMAGQLEGEIHSGAWHVIDANPNLVFADQFENRKTWKQATNMYGSKLYKELGIQLETIGVG